MLYYKCKGGQSNGNIKDDPSRQRCNRPIDVINRKTRRWYASYRLWEFRRVITHRVERAQASDGSKTPANSPFAIAQHTGGILTREEKNDCVCKVQKSERQITKARITKDVRYQEWTEMTLDCRCGWKFAVKGHFYFIYKFPRRFEALRQCSQRNAPLPPFHRILLSS